MRGQGTAIVDVRKVVKHFGGVAALDGVSLSVRPGEIHGLLGENGSGKSTLIKILAGFHSPDEGELFVQGKNVPLPLRAGEFQRLGFSFVHQDLGLIPSLSVIENLRIAELATGQSFQHISWRRERRLASQVFRFYGVDMDPSASVHALRPVERAILAIIRAVEAMRSDGNDAKKGLLVLDEPTVFLPTEEKERLFNLVRGIAAGGDAVLVVSHDLDEVRVVTDRITVIRDGRNVATLTTSQTTEHALIELIIGHKVGSLSGRRTVGSSETEVRLRVAGMSGQSVENINFELRRSEVVGLTGLQGSGFEEVPYLLFGASRAVGGRLALDGKDTDARTLTPRRALALGIVLVPADRQRDGAVSSLPVTDNLTIHAMREFLIGVYLDRGAMTRRARELMRLYDVRPHDPRLPYASLSGGNQQKALLAKWMQTHPSVLLLHEPTQGVDVGAREQIFAFISKLAARGTPVICASSDYEQLASVCDRVLILARGRIVQELSGADVTKERIAERCYASINPIAETNCDSNI